jgi:hypothetical protein
MYVNRDIHRKFFLAACAASLYFSIGQGFELMDDRTFNDEQLTSGCDMHIDNLRQLITWKAVIPYQRGGGRGRIRLWTMTHVHRVSMTASIFNAGFSLRMAHTLAYLIMMDELLCLYDPLNLEMNGGDRSGWFDPNKPRVEPDEDDWYLDVVNGRFVYLDIGSDPEQVRQPMVYGELNRDRTILKSMIDFAHYSGPVDTDPANVVDTKYLTETRPKWERFWMPTPEVDPSSLAWKYEPNLDEDLANDLFTRPKSKQVINLTLGLRVAVRRVLDLPVDYP